jgi:pyruvate/2-oxoglutarate dehydrogenase complex dihydrolipoamide dehydrogenase (E3) component
MLVYGGGETGCETAEYLAERGHPVVLVSRSPARQLARAAEAIYRSVLLQRLRANALVTVREQTQLTRIASDGVVHLQHADGTAEQFQVSRVLIAQGRTPTHELRDELIAAGVPCVEIGDARTGGRIGDAVHDAYRAIHALCATTAPTLQPAC